MEKEINKEKLWKLYDQLPKRLKEAVLSEETAENIFDICVRNEISEEKIPKISRYVGRVLMGLILIEDFYRILVEEIKLKEDLAQKVGHEIYRFIFAPVKDEIAEITGKKTLRPEEVFSKKQDGTLPPTEIEKERDEVYRYLKEEKEFSKKDTYREPIE